MKKNLKIILGITLVVFMLPTLVTIFAIKNNIDKVNAETTQAGFVVDATNSSTYHIYDADGYKDFVDFVNTEGNNCGEGYTFVLENSLILKKQVSSLIIEEFNGKFNGQFNTIKGLPCFTKVNNGEITKLVINNDVSAKPTTGVSYAGSYSHNGTTWYGIGVIAGINNKEITYCGVENASINAGENSYTVAGSIAGLNSGDIYNCFAYNNYLTTSATSEVSLGGIAGYFCGEGKTISNCVSANNIFKGKSILNINANILASLSNSEIISSDDYTGATNFGGIVGGAVINYNLLETEYPQYPSAINLTISNCYSDENIYATNSVDLDFQICPVEPQFYLYLSTEATDGNNFLKFIDNYSSTEESCVIGETQYSTSTYTYYDNGVNAGVKTVSEIGYYARTPGYIRDSGPDIVYEGVLPAGTYDYWWTLGKFGKLWTFSGATIDVYEGVSAKYSNIVDTNWVLPTTTDDHGGYPYFGEPNNYNITLQYYSSNEDFRTATKADATDSEKQNAIKTITVSQSKLNDQSILDIINNAVMGTYDGNGNFQSIEKYVAYGTKNTDIYIVNTSGRLIYNSDFNIDSYTLGSDITIKPIYKEVTLSLKYVIKNIDIPKGSVDYSYKIGEGDATTGNFSVDSVGDISLGTKIYSFSSFNNDQKINLSFSATYNYTDSQTLPLFVFYKLTGAGVDASNSLEEDVLVENLINHDGKYETSWAPNTLSDGYKSNTSISVNIEVSVYAEMGINANCNGTKYSYSVLYHTNCTFKRDGTSLSSLNPNFNFGGKSCKGFYDDVSGSETLVTNARLQFYDSKYTTHDNDGETIYNWSETPLEIYAVFADKSGDYTYTLFAKQFGGLLNSTTKINVKIAFKINYTINGTNTNSYLYLSSNPKYSDNLSENLDDYCYFVLASGASGSLVIHYSDATNSSHYITWGGTTAYCSVFTIDSIELLFKIEVTTPTNNATYYFTKKSSSSDGITAGDLSSVDSNNSAVAGSSNLSFPSTDNDSNTIKWQAQGDGETYINIAELIKINLRDNIWAFGSDPEKKYLINDTDIATSLGKLSKYADGLKGFHKDVVATDTDYFITADKDKTGTYTYTIFAVNQAVLDLYAQYKDITVYYHPYSSSYLAENGWTYVNSGDFVGCYQYTLAQKDRKFAYELACEDDDRTNFKGWFATKNILTGNATMANIQLDEFTTTQIEKSWFKADENGNPVMHIYEYWEYSGGIGGAVSVQLTINCNSSNGTIQEVTQEVNYEKIDGVWNCSDSVLAPSIDGYIFNNWTWDSSYDSWFDETNNTSNTVPFKSNLSSAPSELFIDANYVLPSEATIDYFIVVLNLNSDNSLVDNYTTENRTDTDVGNHDYIVGTNWWINNGLLYHKINSSSPTITSWPSTIINPKGYAFTSDATSADIEFSDRTTYNFWQNKASMFDDNGAYLNIYELVDKSTGSAEHTVNVVWHIGSTGNVITGSQISVANILTLGIKVLCVTTTISGSQVNKYYILPNNSYNEYSSMGTAEIPDSSYVSGYRTIDIVESIDLKSYLKDSGWGFLEENNPNNFYSDGSCLTGFDTLTSLTQGGTTNAHQLFCKLTLKAIPITLYRGNTVLGEYLYCPEAKALKNLNGFSISRGLTVGDVIDGETDEILAICNSESLQLAGFSAEITKNLLSDWLVLSNDKKTITFSSNIDKISSLESYITLITPNNSTGLKQTNYISYSGTKINVYAEFTGEGVATIHFGYQFGDIESSRVIDGSKDLLFQYLAPYDSECAGITNLKWIYSAGAWSKEIDTSNKYVCFATDVTSYTIFNIGNQFINTEYKIYYNNGGGLKQLKGFFDISSGLHILDKSRINSDIATNNLMGDFDIYVISCYGAQDVINVTINFMSNSTNSPEVYDQAMTVVLNYEEYDTGTGDSTTVTGEYQSGLTVELNPFVKGYQHIYSDPYAKYGDPYNDEYIDEDAENGGYYIGTFGLFGIGSTFACAPDCLDSLIVEGGDESWFILTQNGAQFDSDAFLASSKNSSFVMPTDITLTFNYNTQAFVINDDVSGVRKQHVNENGNGETLTETLVHYLDYNGPVKIEFLRLVGGQKIKTSFTFDGTSTTTQSVNDMFSEPKTSLTTNSRISCLKYYYHSAVKGAILQFGKTTGYSMSTYSLEESYKGGTTVITITNADIEDYAEIDLYYKLGEDDEIRFGGTDKLYFYYLDTTISSGIGFDYNFNNILTNPNTNKTIYKFKGWMIENVGGLDYNGSGDYRLLFNPSNITEGILELYTCSSVPEGLSGKFNIKLTAIYEVIPNVCEITLYYIDENGTDISDVLNTDSNTLYYYYDTEGVRDGDKVYYNGIITAPEKEGYGIYSGTINSDGFLSWENRYNQVLLTRPTGTTLGKYTAEITFKYFRLNTSTLKVKVIAHPNDVSNTGEEKLEESYVIWTNSSSYSSVILPSSFQYQYGLSSRLNVPNYTENGATFSEWVIPAGMEDYFNYFSSINHRIVDVTSNKSLTWQSEVYIEAHFIYTSEDIITIYVYESIDGANADTLQASYKYNYKNSSGVDGLVAGAVIAYQNKDNLKFVGWSDISWISENGFDVYPIEIVNNELKTVDISSNGYSGSAEIKVIANYENNMLIIEVECVDEQGNTLNTLTSKYYYSSFNETSPEYEEGWYYDSPYIFGYEFKYWEKVIDGGCWITLEENEGVIQYIAIAPVKDWVPYDDETGTYDNVGNVTYKFKAVYSSSKYISIVVNYINDNGERINGVSSDEYIYHYVITDEASRPSNALIVGDEITANSVLGHRFIGWKFEDASDKAIFENLTFDSYKGEQIATNNPLTLKQVESATNIVLNVICEPDVARINVVRINEENTILESNIYEFYYNSTYVSGKETSYNINNIGESLPTALTSLKGVFIGWNLTDSSENYLNFFNGDVNDLTFKQCDISGVQTLTMIAVYESNIAEFIMCLSTDDGLSNEEKAVYTFNYRENTGINGTLNYGDNFKFDMNKTDVFTVSYEFKYYQISLLKGENVNYTDLYTINIEDIMTAGADPTSCYGRYSIKVIAVYLERNIAVINVDYVDADKLDVDAGRILGTDSYIFYYSNNAPYALEDYELDLNSTISIKTFEGYNFIIWTITGFEDFFEEYESGTNLKTKATQPKDDSENFYNGFREINITANYEECVYEIHITNCDVDSGYIIDDTNVIYYYYYNGTTKTGENVITTSGVEISIPEKAGYTFKDWTTEDETYGYISLGDKLITCSSSGLPTNRYIVNVKCNFVANTSLFIDVKVKSLHWEEKEYNNNDISVSSDINYVFYHHGKTSYNNGEYGPGQYLIAGVVEGYNFMYWEIRAQLQIGETDIPIFSLTNLSQFSYLDGSKINGKSISEIQSAMSSFYTTENLPTSCMFNEISALARYYSMLDNYLVNNGSLTFEIIAYYSKTIDLINESAKLTQTKTFNVPINYIVDSINFSNLSKGENSDRREFNYLIPCQVEYNYDSVAILSSDATIRSTNPTNYKLVAVKSCEPLIAVNDESVVDKEGLASVYNFVNGNELINYTPKGYMYSGWGKELPTANDASNITDEELFDLIKEKVNDSYLPNSLGIDDSDAVNLYMQWQAKTYTIICVTPVGDYELNYNACSGQIGELSFDFDAVLRNDNTFVTEITKNFGTFSSIWKIKNMASAEGESSYAFYNSSGELLNVGDDIEGIYKNSYGLISVEMIITDYTNLVLEFNYNVLSSIYTDDLGSIYNAQTGELIKNYDANYVRYYINNDINYSSNINLRLMLEDNYLDPNPVSVNYNGTRYYLAGWTFVDNPYKPSNWANLTDDEKTKYLSIVLNSNDNYFVREFDGQGYNIYNSNSSIYKGSRLDLKIISYDGTLSHIYGNGTKLVNGVNSSVITMYAVWLPYYELNIYSMPLGETDNSYDSDIYLGENIYYQAKSSTAGGKYSIYYGRTLSSQSMTLSYDVMTMIDKIPTVSGLNIAKSKYYLDGLKIIGNDSYVYASEYPNSWTSTTDYSNSTKYYFYNLISSPNTSHSYIDFGGDNGIYAKFIDTIRNKTNIDWTQIAIDVYPKWIDGNITINLSADGFNGIYETVSTEIKLKGSYLINTNDDEILKNRYSIDNITTTIDSLPINSLCGYDFDYASYQDATETALKTLNGFERLVLKLDAQASYVGNLYFLQIYSQDHVDGAPYIDNSINVVGSVASLAGQTQKMISISKTGAGITYTNLSILSVPNLVSKRTYPTENVSNYSYVDSSEFYNYCKNKVLEDGGNYYLCLVYGDKVEDTNGNTLLQTLERTDGTKLGYYLYSGKQNNNKYAYDVENGNGLIQYVGHDKVLKNYSGSSNVICTNVWGNEDFNEYWIGAVWNVKEYYIDLTVGLMGLNVQDSNSGYLSIEVKYESNQSENKYYVLNYEMQDTKYGYNLYELSYAQYNSKTTYYDGWNGLGITPIKSNKILVKTGAKVYIHAFDQSVDSLADCMIGYRFTKTRIKNPNETNVREVLVENVEQIPYTDDNGVTTNYILVDGYTTTIDLTTVKLDDKATINYQMILTRINYSLKVFTDKYVGVLAVYYKNVDYTNNFEFNFNSINVDDSMGATFYPNIGYELASWRLNDNNNFETLYSINCNFDASFLRTYVYNSGIYSAMQNQNIGELEAVSKLIEFRLNIELINRYHMGDSITSFTLPNTNSIVYLGENVLGEGIEDKNFLTLNSNYIISILTDNLSQELNDDGFIYLTFKDENNKHYAILEMYIKGKSKNYSNVSYDFPTNVYEELQFKLDAPTLTDLVIYNLGEAVLEENRVINLRIECAEVFKIASETDISNPSTEDLLKGTRSLLGGVNSTVLANGTEGQRVVSTSKYAYAHENQEIELKVVAPSEYYSGVKLTSKQLDAEFELALSDSLKFIVEFDTYFDIVFMPSLLNYDIKIKYGENSYGLNEIEQILNIGGNRVVNSSPTVTITGDNGSVVRIDKFYYGDNLKLSFASNWLAGENDYRYLVNINNKVAETKDSYDIRFDKDLNILIEIFNNSSGALVFKNISESAQVVGKTTTGEAVIIDGPTTFNMIASEDLTIYFKLNPGYSFDGFTYIETEYYTRNTTSGLVPNLINSGDFAGYLSFKLIENYSSSKKGDYQINFNEIEYLVEFVYYVHDTEIEQPGGEYTVDSPTQKYSISKTAIISQTQPDTTSSGYRFIGFTIGGSIESGKLAIDGGATQISVILADYAEIISSQGKLIVYVNYIYQYTISFDVDSEDFGQTQISLSSEKPDNSSNEILKITTCPSTRVTTSYFDESNYSNLKYKILISSKQIKYYYVNVYLDNNLVPLNTDDEGFSCDIIDDTSYNYRISYEFSLNKNYLFKVVYKPREYNSKLEENFYDTISKLNGDSDSLIKSSVISEGILDTNLSAKEAEQIQISVSATRKDLLNCYNTELTITIIINKVYDNKQYEFYKLTINGQEVECNLDETSDSIIVTYTHLVVDEFTIGVHYKQIYTIEVSTD